MNCQSLSKYAGISYVLIQCASLLCIGCGVPTDQYAHVTHERDSLAAALDASRKELDEVKFGASRLLASATAAYGAGRFEEARDLAGQLLTRHPDAPETSDGKVLAGNAERALAERAAAATRAKVDSERAEQRRLAQALGKVYKRRDELRSVSFYYANGTSHFVNERSQILLYVVKPDDSSPDLRFSVRYVADDWLFIQGYTFKIDGVSYEIDASGFNDVERDNGYGGIWEWYDVVAESNELEIARAIAASKHAVMRYRGKQYYRDRTIGPDEKSAIRHVLDAYDVLKARS